MHILAVILHYGPAARTRQVHAQLLGANPDRVGDIRVFDNASAEPYPGAWKRAATNLFWAGALEHVLMLAADEGATHVWFLNNDVLFVPPAPGLHRVEARLRRAGTLCGPVGVYAPAVTRNPYHPQMVALRNGQFRQVRYVDGIAPVVSLDFWRSAGGVDCAGNPFGYGVDVWFSVLAERYGYTCVVDHQVVIRHHYHSTAREVDGFMARAAAAEARYLTDRMGPDYRQRIAAMSGEFREIG